MARTAADYPGFLQATSNYLLRPVPESDYPQLLADINAYEALVMSPQKVVTRAARRMYGEDFAEVLNKRLSPAFAHPLPLREKIKLWNACRYGIDLSSVDNAALIRAIREASLANPRHVDVRTFVEDSARRLNAPLSTPSLFEGHEDVWFALLEWSPIPPQVFQDPRAAKDVARELAVPLNERQPTSETTALGGRQQAIVDAAGRIWGAVYSEPDASDLHGYYFSGGAIASLSDTHAEYESSARPVWRAAAVVACVGLAGAITVLAISRRAR